MAKRNPVGWFEIYVSNLRRARSFYERTFKIKLVPLNSPIIKMLAFPAKPDQAGAGGALVRMKGKEPGGGTLVYFSCADCAKVADRAVKYGGEIFQPNQSIGQYGFIALVLDTEGNMIGLHSIQ